MWTELRNRMILLTLGLALLFPACAAFTAQPPQGFAPYKDNNPFRAVSPEGVIYRVRQEANDPEADLKFWKEALKKRMLDAGYRFVSEADVEASSTPGYILELNAPLGTQDYTYVNALFVKGKHLIIVEAAGEITRFKTRREAVMTAIKGLQL